MMEYMDKWYVLDDIFPILAEIPSREPAVLMSMLGKYWEVSFKLQQYQLNLLHFRYL